MPCNIIGGAIVCHMTKSYRLRLSDGRYVFMNWHHFCGPEFYEDRLERRHIDKWWEDQQIVEALEWFQKRGNRA